MSVSRDVRYAPALGEALRRGAQWALALLSCVSSTALGGCAAGTAGVDGEGGHAAQSGACPTSTIEYDAGCADPDVKPYGSVGCRFYAIDTNPMIATHPNSYTPGPYAVVVSNVDPVAAAAVVIEQKTGSDWSQVPDGSFTVGPLALVTTVLPHRYIAGSAIHAGGAYRITSDRPIIAYQFNPLHGSSSYLSDASLLLPAWAYDTDYILPAWPYGPADDSASSGFPAHLQVVARAPTQVTVTSPVLTEVGSTLHAIAPNGTATFCLEEGDYLQLTVKQFMDSLNGAYIAADQPVGVFTSNDCANVPALGTDACCCDHLEEQVFPLSTWGTRYVAARVPQRESFVTPRPPPGSDGSVAVWQIMAHRDDTTVQFDRSAQATGLPPSVTLNAREMAQYQVGGPASSPGDFLVTADKPILVTQYMVGGRYDDDGGVASFGDPSMILAVPVEQYLSEYVVLVPKTWEYDYLVISREQGALVSLDAEPVDSGWIQVGASKFDVTRVRVSDGVHLLAGSMPLGVTVVGYDGFDSYGYPGGLNQLIINPIE